MKTMDGRGTLMDQLRAFTPYNAQEEMDRALILDQLERVPDIFSRENRLAHMTASAWVLSPSHNRVLMAYHNIYNSWSWLGGHADGEIDLLAVALREVREESGIATVRAISPLPISVESLTVDGHVKRGQYVSSHLHLNVTYLLEADDRGAFHAKPDENSAVGWFAPDDAVAASTEPWFREHIYSKLNEKVRRMKL